jgi:hypothetical protein
MMPVQSAEWNPWLDVKEDGRINVLDLIKTASALGTMGDTTKNVMIAGHANKLAYSVQDQTIPAHSSCYSPYISVDGYSKVTVNLQWIYGAEYVDNGYLLVARHFNGTYTFRMDEATNITSLVKTYDVPNQEILVMILNYDTAPRYFCLDVYLKP